VPDPVEPAPIATSPTPERSRFARTFESLAIRDFRLLWSGTILSGFGQWGQQISLNWLVFVLTDSAVQLGGVSAAAGIVAITVTPFAGLLADRVPRRTILWTSSLFGAATAGVIAVLVIANLIEVWHAYAFALISGLSMAINQPARQAAVYDTSTPDTFQNAVAMNSLAMNLARIVGPIAAGFIAVWSLTAAFALVTLMRALAALTAFMLTHRPAAAVSSGRSPLADIVEGFRYLFSDARLASLWFVNAFPAFIVYPYVAFLPVFSEEVLGAGSGGYGLLAAMMGIGSTVGLLILAVIGSLSRRGLWMMTGFLTYLGFIAVFTQSEILYLSLALLVGAGVVHGFALTLNTVLFQTAVRDDMRGRGMAAWQLGFALMPLGALPVGFLIERYDVQTGTLIPVILCAAVFIPLTLLWRPLRTMP
jgi:MFS family permease